MFTRKKEKEKEKEKKHLIIQIHILNLARLITVFKYCCLAFSVVNIRI